MAGLYTNGLPTVAASAITGAETTAFDTNAAQGVSPQQEALSLVQLGLGGSVTAFTAFAGGGQASATALGYGTSRVDTVGSAADSVKLPTAVIGARCLVINNAASNSMQVFGSGTDTINGVATGTGVAQAAGKAALYVCTTAAPAAAWFRLLSA